MSGGHSHGARAGARHRRPLAVSFGLVASFMVVEFVTAFATDSLALLSDAGHMAADAVGLGMALAAITAADRVDPGGSRTFGLYRLEILAALANAALLIAVATYAVVEAVRRFGAPPEIVSGPMLVVAVIGLCVNLVSWRLLREGADASLNVKGAYFEVGADLIGSIGAISAALLVRYASWNHADPLFAVAISLFILPRAVRLGRSALRVLVQAAPENVDVEAMRMSLQAIDGVTDIHDLHVWTLTSEMDVASVHLVTREGTDPHPILDRASELLRSDYAIAHATLQVEPDSHHGCTEISW